MTVAITTAPIMAKSATPGTSADSTAIADTPVTGADFASLLLGQLAAGANLQQGIVDHQAPPAITDRLETDLIDTPADPQDAALLLAALGIAPPQQNGKATTVGMDTPLVGHDKVVSAIPLANASVNPDAAQLASSLEADAGIESILPGPLEADDKAAKFAVRDFAVSKPDALAVKSLPSDSSPAQMPVAASLSPNQPGNTSLIPSTPLRVDTPVRDPAWSGDFSQKVVWLTANDQKFAQLTLNPPQMGPIEISLNINKDTASAYFISPNAEVREAIETALPRLREMLAGVGIELGQANVSAQSSRQENGNPEARQGTPRWIADEDILGGDSRRSQATIAQRGNSLVDTFA